MHLEETQLTIILFAKPILDFSASMTSIAELTYGHFPRDDIKSLRMLMLIKTK